MQLRDKWFRREKRLKQGRPLKIMNHAASRMSQSVKKFRNNSLSCIKCNTCDIKLKVASWHKKTGWMHTTTYEFEAIFCRMIYRF